MTDPKWLTQLKASREARHPSETAQQRMTAHIKAIVDRAPPLTEQQALKLRQLLAPSIESGE